MLFGQSNDKELVLSPEPFFLNTYFPVIASTIPSPPEVPGKKALIKAED
jgi:hypothetical protein